MPELTAPVSHLSPSEAARVLRVKQGVIAGWQRAGLLRDGDCFSLRDLARMRSLRELRERVSARSIRTSVHAMQTVVDDPLTESVAVPQGARLLFRYGGALLDPLTQQLGFDFEPAARRELSLLRRGQPREDQARDHARAQDLFQRAVQLEERQETVAEAAALYGEVMRLWPRHAAANINLGTIHYNARRFHEAEQRYRTAAEIDPDYALAFFDLGNVLDELRRLPEAIAAYARAIQLVPQYADAHYNLALAYERTGERRRALRHWLRYVRLDPVGPWATHARMQARRTLAGERLRIVTSGGKLLAG